jgi:molecular chaperone GrpE
VLTRETASDAINRVGSGAAGDFPLETPRPVSGTGADPNVEMEDLRSRARERDQFHDLLLRTRADFENYQKRARREREEERRYQHGPVILALLPVLDDLERATAAAEWAGDTGPLAQGVELVRAMFLDVLRRHGVTPVKAFGQPFDPNLHHAVMHRPVAGQPANAVVQVLKEGYRIHDRLLRPAEVVVAAPETQT